MVRALLHMILFLTAAALSAGIVAGLLANPLAPPQSYLASRARWEHERLHHYQLEIELTSPWREIHLMLEIRDEQVIGGYNVRTGMPLSVGELATQRLWLPVDRLFDRVELLVHHNPTLPERIGGLAPAMAGRLKFCIDPPPQIQYHPRYGYPQSIRFFQNTCHAAQGVSTVVVAITDLQ